MSSINLKKPHAPTTNCFLMRAFQSSNFVKRRAWNVELFKYHLKNLKQV